LIKNSQPFGKKIRKPQGGFFLTHTVVRRQERGCGVLWLVSDWMKSLT